MLYSAVATKEKKIIKMRNKICLIVLTGAKIRSISCITSSFMKNKEFIPDKFGSTTYHSGYHWSLSGYIQLVVINWCRRYLLYRQDFTIEYHIKYEFYFSIYSVSIWSWCFIVWCLRSCSWWTYKLLIKSIDNCVIIIFEKCYIQL